MSDGQRSGYEAQLQLGIPLMEADVLRVMKGGGAPRICRVVFRPNRSTIWSITQQGRVLNLHEGYRMAPLSVIRSFAVIVAEARRPGPAYEWACKVVRHWPGIDKALNRSREDGLRHLRPRRKRSLRCAGNAREQSRSRELYEAFNAERFKDRLPADMTIRISARMRTRLGHVTPEGCRRRRSVGEIALNKDLFRSGNDAILRETLLHEMAHVAAYLFEGDAGHGLPWRRWAERAGCLPTACIPLPVK